MTQATAEKLAIRMLASSGLRSIWDCYVAASAAHGLGKADVAEALIEIAEAAGRVCARQGELESTDGLI